MLHYDDCVDNRRNNCDSHRRHSDRLILHGISVLGNYR